MYVATFPGPGVEDLVHQTVHAEKCTLKKNLFTVLSYKLIVCFLSPIQFIDSKYKKNKTKIVLPKKKYQTYYNRYQETHQDMDDNKLNLDSANKSQQVLGGPMCRVELRDTNAKAGNDGTG